MRIAAANVNPTDIGARSGPSRRMPELKPPFVLGWDLAGEVSDWARGRQLRDRGPGGRDDPVVPGRGRFGAYAQAEVVRPEWLVRRPPELDAITGATVPVERADRAPGARGAWTAAARGDAPDHRRERRRRLGTRPSSRSPPGCACWAIASEGDEEWVGSLGAAEVLPRSIDLEKIEPVDAPVRCGPDRRRGDGGCHAARRRRVHASEWRFRSARICRSKRRSCTPIHAGWSELTKQVAAGTLRTRVARTLRVDGRRRGTPPARAGRPARQDRTDNRIGGEMARIVLVHGAFAGAWCWEPVVPGLRRGRPPGRGDRPAREPARTRRRSRR